MAIAMVVASAFMIALRVLRLAGSDQTLLQTANRFGPPLSAALCASFATGAFMVIGEPERDLMSFSFWLLVLAARSGCSFWLLVLAARSGCSFWLKMSLLAIATIGTAAFRIAVRRNENYWEEAIIDRRTTRSVVILMLMIWAGVIISGRLIAYDSIWGAWSPVPKD